MANMLEKLVKDKLVIMRDGNVRMTDGAEPVEILKS